MRKPPAESHNAMKPCHAFPMTPCWGGRGIPDRLWVVDCYSERHSKPDLIIQVLLKKTRCMSSGSKEFAWSGWYCLDCFTFAFFRRSNESCARDSFTGADDPPSCFWWMQASVFTLSMRGAARVEGAGSVSGNRERNVFQKHSPKHPAPNLKFSIEFYSVLVLIVAISFATLFLTIYYPGTEHSSTSPLSQPLSTSASTARYVIPALSTLTKPRFA